MTFSNEGFKLNKGILLHVIVISSPADGGS